MITYLVNSSILPGVAEAKVQAGDLASDAVPSEDPLRVVTRLTAVHSEGQLWIKVRPMLPLSPGQPSSG